MSIGAVTGVEFGGGFQAAAMLGSEWNDEPYIDDKGRVLLTTAGTISGPMTGALARDWQGCCLEFSIFLLPCCGSALVGAAAFQFIPLPLKRGATAIRLSVWTVGLLVWFMGGIVSFGHALS